MKKIYVIIILFISLTSCLTTPAMRENDILRARVDELEKEIRHLKGDSSLELVSPIVDISQNYRNMPLYCNPRKYSIGKIGNKYFIRLPHGTLGSESYNTPEEAQNEINRYAEVSLKRWIETGGNSF